MAPSSTIDTSRRASRPRQAEPEDDLASLKPRARRSSLYPTIPDFILMEETTDLTELAFNSPPVQKQTSRRSSNRSSVTSVQTLPTVTSDCSVQDLEAIQMAMLSDEEESERAKVLSDEEEAEMSKALVHQLIREDLGLSSRRSSTLSAVPDEVDDIASLREQNKSSAQDLIYQLCLKLDEVHVDVKSENWKMLAPHEINKLEVFSYDASKQEATTTTATTNSISRCSSSCENDDKDKCLICQTNYQHNDSLRKLRCCHVFHRECVDPWLLQHDFCPVCRKPIDEE